MDPNQTYADMLEAIELNDRETARELALALRYWLSRGGFYPAETKPEQVDACIKAVIKGVRSTEH